MVLGERNQRAGATFTHLVSEYPDLQVPLFLVFLIIYTVTVEGNLGMIIIIRTSPKLHTPMYYFLSHLSFVDFCYSTSYTQTLGELGCGRQNYLLHQMHHAILLGMHICGCKNIHVSSDGL